MSALAPEVDRRTTAGDDDDLDHVFCECDPDLALCGKDISDEEIGECRDDLVCVVCDELTDLPCERCGE